MPKGRYTLGREYIHEHFATVPKGAKVRTVTVDDHRVRIAYWGKTEEKRRHKYYKLLSVLHPLSEGTECKVRDEVIRKGMLRNPRSYGRIDYMPRLKMWKVVWYSGTYGMGHEIARVPTQAEAIKILQEEVAKVTSRKRRLRNPGEFRGIEEWRKFKPRLESVLAKRATVGYTPSGTAFNIQLAEVGTVFGASRSEYYASFEGPRGDRIFLIVPKKDFKAKSLIRPRNPAGKAKSRKGVLWRKWQSDMGGISERDLATARAWFDELYNSGYSGQPITYHPGGLSLDYWEREVVLCGRQDREIKRTRST